MLIVKVLVIGGTGFMGRRLVRNLLAAGADVTIATRGISDNPFGESVRKIVLDRFDEKSLYSSIKKDEYYDLVYDQIGFGPDDIKLTLSVLDGKVGRYIYTSSLAVYPQPGRDMTEDVFSPLSHEIKEGGMGNLGYPEGKRSAEAYLFKNASFPVAVARFPIVVGYGDVSGRLQFHCDSIMEGREIVIPSPCGKMNFIWVEDAGRFLAWLGLNGKEGPYNPASPEQIDAREIVRKLASVLGREANIVDSGEDSRRSPYYRPEIWTMSTKKATGEGFVFTPLDEWLPIAAKKAVENGGKKGNSRDYLGEKIKKKD